MMMGEESRVLAELARGPGVNRRETHTPTTAPGVPVTWPIRVLGKVERNRYNVVLVDLGVPGMVPVATSAPFEAVNLHESFLAEGVIAAGSYAMAVRMGARWAFYRAP